MELTSEMKDAFIEGAKQLKGSERRLFMARFVKGFGRGGQSFANRELGWDRDTIRKGLQELESGFVCIDNFQARGRKPAEVHLPNLLTDITSIAEAYTQTDPTFQTTRLYCRLTAPQVRKELLQKEGYTEENTPAVRTISDKLNMLGYRLRRVQKTKPKKNP